MRHNSPLEWRNSLALGLVQCAADNLSVVQLDVWLADVSLEGKGVLHPLVIVSVREVLSGVSTSGLLSGRGGDNGLNGVLHDVSQLKSLDKVANCQQGIGNSQ